MESPGKIKLPSTFEHDDTYILDILIANMLGCLIEHNDKIPLSRMLSHLLSEWQDVLLAS